MKKITILIFVVALSIMALLYACDKDNADTNTNSNLNQNENQNGKQTTDVQTSTGEQIYGMVQSIDGVTITIDASQLVVFGETGQYFFDSNDEPVKEVNQKTTVCLTDETVITVRTNRGGQITGERAGIIDDLSLWVIVNADGYWQNGEFIATTILIINH